MAEVRRGHLKSHELRELAENNAIVIVPVASIEQHGSHLPVQVDMTLWSERGVIGDGRLATPEKGELLLNAAAAALAEPILRDETWAPPF